MKYNKILNKYIDMNDNIFLKNKKFNPDIDKNLNSLINERNNAKFTFKNEFINPINKSQEKNAYKKDEPINMIDELVKKKLEERSKQEFEYKPQKNFVPSSNPNDFKQYNDLKDDQLKYEVKENKKTSDNFNSIVDDLLKLGILN